jgi:hypothetical protein
MPALPGRPAILGDDAWEPLQLYHCGCCNCYHRVWFGGDCRDDAERFACPEDAAERLGISPFDVEVVWDYADPEDDDGLAPEG